MYQRVKKDLAFGGSSLTVSLLALGLAASGITALGGSTGATAASDGSTIVTVEQAPPVVVASNLEFASANNFSGKYIEATLDGYTPHDQISLAEDSVVSTEAGVVSVVNGEIWFGNGDGTAERVGQIDSTSNGDGKQLRVNFISSFPNAGFEDSPTSYEPWQVINRRVLVGTDKIEGFTIPEFRKNGSLDMNRASMRFISEISTAQKASGAQSLKLESKSLRTDSYGQVFGPAAYSVEFTASKDQRLSFSYRAIGGDDHYSIYAALLNTTEGVADSARWTQIVRATGSSTAWLNAEVVVPENGSYRFVFISGTYDATGGHIAGAALYVDDVRVLSESVSAAVASAVAQRISYANTSDNPPALRLMTITGEDATGARETKTHTIEIEPVDDPHAASDSYGVFVNSSNPADAFAPLLGTVVASDPDGDRLALTAVGAEPGSYVFGGVTYTAMLPGEFVDLWVNEEDLSWVMVPKADSLNEVFEPTEEVFAVKVISLDGDQGFTAEISVTADVRYDMKPGAPTVVAITPTLSADQLSIEYEVEFDEFVSGFTASKILLSGTSGQASGDAAWSISEPTLVPGTTKYRFTASSSAPINGSVNFSIATAGIKDFAFPENTLVTPSAGVIAQTEVIISQLPSFDPGQPAFLAQAATPIAPEFTLNSWGSGMYQMRIEMVDPQPGDLLSFTNQLGISGSWSSSENAIYLTGTNAISDADWQTALRAVKFSTSSTVEAERSFEYHMRAAPGYDYVSGSFFSYVAANQIQLASAATAAAASRLFGLQGYLATPTSPSQQAAMLAAGPQQQSWLGIGAVGGFNDRVKILYGPGTGEIVMYAPCSNWNQVNHTPLNGIPHISTMNGGCWNDLGTSDFGTIKGYMVEFGGSQGDPVLQVLKTTTHTLDLIGPSVTRVFALAAGEYTMGENLDIVVEFDEPVLVSGGGANSTLEVLPGVFAELISGSGTDRLVYRLSVGPNLIASEVDYVSATSLIAGNLTLADAAGNAANLTLPEPGEAGSLSSETQISLAGNKLDVRIEAVSATTQSPNVGFSISSPVALDCTSITLDDFEFENLDPQSFSVNAIGDPTACRVTLAHTVLRGSFASATLTASENFAVSASGQSHSTLRVISNTVLVTNPAQQGQGTVDLIQTGFDRPRPTEVSRINPIGLLPGAAPESITELARQNIFAPPNIHNLPEVLLRGDFSQLTDMNERIAARKQQVIRAGDVITTQLSVPHNRSADFKVISYLNVGDGFVFGGESAFDESGEVVTDPLVFTQPGEYVLRMFVVPVSFVAGVDFPVAAQNLQVQFGGARSFGIASTGTASIGAFSTTNLAFVFLVANDTSLLSADDLNVIQRSQDLELILIIEPNDGVTVPPLLPAFVPPQSTPGSPEGEGPGATVLPGETPTPPGPSLREPAPGASSAAPAPTPTARPGADSQAASGTDAASGTASDGSASDGPSQSSVDDSSSAGAGADSQAAAGQQPSGTTAVTQLEPYDPFGSPEATRQTTGLLAALAALAAVAAVAAAAGAASAASASSAASSSGGMGAAEMNEDSLDALSAAEFELDVFRDEKDRWGDKLAIWAIPLLSFLDRPTHRFTRSSARFSPLVSKLLNDGAYLRAMLGSVSILPTLAAIGLAIWALQLNDEILLHPPIALFIAIMVIGLFDSFAGALGVLVFVLGSLPLLNPAEVTDWRMLAGIIVAGFGPVVLARSIRNFRRKAPRDNQAWLDRIGDVAFASLLGGWVAGLVVRALPALTGLAVPAAEYVFEVQVIATIAIALRIVLEDLAARFYPSRMDDLTPDTLPEPFRGQRTLVTVLRYFFYVFIASAFMGFGFVVWVAAALFMVPTLLGLFIDKLPRVKFLANWLPTGLPGLAMILGLEILLENSLADALGDHPDFSTIFVFSLLALIVVVSTLGMLARPEPGELHWLSQPGRQTLYRVGGFVTFLLIVQFTSML